MKMNDLGAETIEFKLNGETISAFAGETIIQAAQRYGTDIPHLCYKEGYRADGNCRACVVEIKGERVLAPSCCRAPAKGMEVQSDQQRARALAEDGGRAAAWPTCPTARGPASPAPTSSPLGQRSWA